MPEVLGTGTDRGFSMAGYGIGLGVSGFRLSRAGFLPSSVSNMRTWFDASNTASVFQSAGGAACTADGDPIGQLQDLSGNTLHVAQTDSLKKPAWRTNVQNGKAVARFDGSNDFLSIATAGVWNTGYQHTMYAVFSPHTLHNGYPVDCSTDNNVNRRFIILNSDGSTLVGRDGGSANYISSTYAANVWYVFVSVLNGPSGYLKVNGTTVNANASATTSTTQSASPFALGGRYTDSTEKYDGDIGEILIYQGAHDLATVQSMENYLKSKWGITY